MKDLTVIMDDQPGKLADLGEATGRAGVNIAGLCAMVGDGKGFIHLLVDDGGRGAQGAVRRRHRCRRRAGGRGRRPARQARRDGGVARDLAEAGVNIDVAYTIFSGVRLVILTEDVAAAREALDGNGAAG